MIALRLLFTGGLVWVPILIGIGLLGLCYVGHVTGRRRGWTIAYRRRILRLGRSLIPILPLAGIFGTVWGLIDTLGFIGRQSSGDIQRHVPQIMERFSVALNTTFWGVLFALLCLVFYQTTLIQLEEADDEGRI